MVERPIGRPQKAHAVNSRYALDEANILRGIATTQKSLIISVAVGFLYVLASVPVIVGATYLNGDLGVALRFAWLFVGLTLVVFYLVLGSKLNSLLGKSVGARIRFVLWFFIFLPIAVLVVDSQATKRLKQAGLKVGFWGADPCQLDTRSKQTQT